MKQLFFIISFLAVSFSFGQAPIEVNIGQISGVVMDKDLGEPIPYATLIINDSAGKFISGNSSLEDGTFIIKDVPAGKHTFIAQFMGYKTYSREIEVTSENRVLNVGEIFLEADVAMLDDVTVIA